MVGIREARHSGGPKRTRRVHRRPGVECREQMAREECQTDADGGKRRGVVLLSGEHEYGERERSRDEHLDEHALRRVDVLGQNIAVDESVKRKRVGEMREWRTWMRGALM